MNKKFSVRDSFISFNGSSYSQSKIFLGRFKDYSGQACDVTSDFCRTVLLIIVGPWLAYVAFIEGNFPQCGPQYIAVFGGTIPLVVRIMWALPMHYQGHFPQYTQDIIMEFLLKIHYYLPTLYSLVICLPIILLYLLTLISTPLLLAYLNPL